ncbi:MAG: hypothetical protein RLZZ15_1085 [Verrucomicrobiota bacterium]
MSELAALFPDGDFRLHLALRRGELREFFAPRDATGAVVAERARWIAGDPARYIGATPEAAPLVAEFAALCAEWELTRATDLARISEALEPDLLVLSPDASGAFVLHGGALCFPTGWALEEKIGRPLDWIHGVVPGLNAALASPIHQFLARLKPGAAFLRDNWGLAATDELNLHPARALPPLAPPVALERLWLRVEHQAFLALPRTGGIVFAIRIALHRLDEVARDREAAAGLQRALRSMPAALAAYKRIDTVRDAVIAQLATAA